VDKNQGEKRVKTPEQALAALMRLASRAEKSSGDALRLMRTWGVAPADQHRILATLTEQKFIDDSRYAAAYVREKSRLNGWGEYKIRQMLASKGIAREVVDSALGQLGEGYGAKLREMLERKMRTLKVDDPYKLKGKLLRYGMSLGYSYDQVAEEVEQAGACSRRRSPGFDLQ
jgi:regulatory protein